MAKYVWQGKAHARSDGTTLMPREEFEPTDEEIRSFGDLMERSDKDKGDEPEVVTSTPNPEIPDVPQKAMLHRPPMNEDGTEPENMPKQVFHKMHPDQRVPEEETESASRRSARRAAPSEEKKE